MKKTILTMLAPALLLSTLLTACGSTGNEATKTSKAEDTTPTDISIFTTFFGTEPPGEDNVIKKEIEKRTNTKLNISWISAEAEQKANVMLASGDIPDMMFISNINSSQFTSMVNQDAFWDVTPFLKDYPNLMKFPEDTWIYTRINGKNFGIPRVRPTEGGSFPYVRKDWLDKLGLKTPTNMDEVYDVIKAFVEKDPDGNGKADTIGMVGLASETSMNTLAWVENIFNKANGEYAMVDGKLINKNILPGTREALVWLNKAYKEKLIPPDFAVLKSAQAASMMKSNKGGMYYGPPEAAWPDVEDLRKLGVKEADTLPLISLNGVTFRDAGFFGMYAIPKTVPEEKVKKILKFMDYGASDEGSTLGNYGIKDTHYKEENGIKIATPQATKDVVSSQSFGQIYQSYDKYFRAYRVGMDAATFERNKKIIDERAKVSIPDHGKGLYSVTDEKLGADYTKKIIALKVKIIMGKEPISAWDTYVDQLKSDANFKKIETEINEAYNVRMGKK